MYCSKCGKYSGKYSLCKDCYYDADSLPSEDIVKETDDKDENDSDLVCPICGEPTRVYMGNARKDRLCGKHADMLKKGEIKLNKTGTFTRITNNEDTDDSASSKDFCVICGSSEHGWKYLCSNCYSTCLEYTKEMNKNQSAYDYKNYYYNSKSNLYTLTGFEKFIKPNCIKLVAIAKACDRYARDNSLLEIVEKDVKEIIQKKKEKDIIQESDENKVVEFNTKKNRGSIRGVDGHFLDSDKEKQIDDLLFSLSIPHAIHYNVPEITERTVNCDWYIPVLPGKGIYMEYFGMDTNDYVRNRDEKISLYQKHKLKLINIDKDETMDTQRLSNHIQQEYKRLKSEILKEADA